MARAGSGRARKDAAAADDAAAEVTVEDAMLESVGPTKVTTTAVRLAGPYTKSVLVWRDEGPGEAVFVWLGKRDSDLSRPGGAEKLTSGSREADLAIVDSTVSYLFAQAKGQFPVHVGWYGT